MIFPFPPYVHVPGRTPRHPESLFRSVKASKDEDAVWAHALALFRAGFYWECHEVLEPLWLRAREGSAERAYIQGVIQLANARLKRRMGWEKAAARLDAIAAELFFEAGRTPPV